MNELRFGHRVRAFAMCDWESAKYIAKESGGKHWVLIDGHNNPDLIEQVKLDPEADEFLIGDEVEFSDDGENWVKGTYGGVNKLRSGNILHFDLYDYKWKDYCRYPRKEKDEANDELDIDKIQKWLDDNCVTYGLSYRLKNHK